MGFDNFFTFYEDENPSLTASNQSFTPILNQNGLDGSVDLSSLSSEYSNIIYWVRRRLGFPWMEVELAPEQIMMCFQEANIKFSSILNTYWLQSWFSKLLGIRKNYTEFDFQSALPNSNPVFSQMFAQNKSNLGLFSGQNVNKRLGFVITNTTQHIYDIYANGIDDITQVPLEQYIASVSGYGIHFTSVFYNSGAYMNRLYDPMTNQQYLNAEFGMPSYPTDTIYYLNPIYQDLARGKLLETSDYTRKSAYQYAVMGRNLELIPTPQASFKLRFEYYIDFEPGTLTNSPLADGSYSGLNYLAQPAPVATSFGNIPITDLTYDNMNSIGRTWIREYTLALCMETLGLIRGKLQTIPIPGQDSISLNAQDLLSRGHQLMDTLVQQLREELAKVDLYEIMRKETDKAQQEIELLKATSPMGIYRY